MPCGRHRSGRLVASRTDSTAPWMAIASAPSSSASRASPGSVTGTTIEIPSPSEMAWLKRRAPITAANSGANGGRGATRPSGSERLVDVRVVERVQDVVVVNREGEVRKLAGVPVDVDRHLVARVGAVVDELDAMIRVLALHQRDRVFHRYSDAGSTSSVLTRVG